MQHSRAITRQSASNLAQALVLLPRSVRDDMAALYAFCRQVDDVADADTAPAAERRTRLAAWRDDVRRACAGEMPAFPVNRELQPVIERRHLPFALFDELIKGCEMDLEITRYESWEQLEVYCHRVACAVGLLSIEVFGYRNPRCRDYAVALGKALQLTNILRDVGTDTDRGRIYLPLAELRRCNVSEEEILRHEPSERFRELAAGVAERARGFYRQARETLPPEDRPTMVAAELMGAVYWRLLRKLERRRFNVFDPRPVRLSKLRKLWLLARAWRRGTPATITSDYGVP
jgi:phytoene synthase